MTDRYPYIKGEFGHRDTPEVDHLQGKERCLALTMKHCDLGPPASRKTVKVKVA